MGLKRHLGDLSIKKDLFLDGQMPYAIFGESSPNFPAVDGYGFRLHDGQMEVQDERGPWRPIGDNSGNTSIIGYTYLQGDTGLSGTQGDTGIQGFTGLRGKAGPAGDNFKQYFTDTDLSNGILIIQHELGDIAAVVVKDDSGAEVIPDGVVFNTTSIEVNLSSFTVSGQWTVFVVTGGAYQLPTAILSGSFGSYILSFTLANLTNGVLRITHNLGQINSIIIRDDSGYQVVPDDVLFVSESVSDVSLVSYGDITGTWTALVLASGVYGLSQSITRIPTAQYLTTAGIETTGPWSNLPISSYDYQDDWFYSTDGTTITVNSLGLYELTIRGSRSSGSTDSIWFRLYSPTIGVIPRSDFELPGSISQMEFSTVVTLQANATISIQATSNSQYTGTCFLRLKNIS